MTKTQVMTELKKLGTAQNRKVYARHGGGPNHFGVSFANLYKIQKKIKQDHELALELFETGNVEAAVLACLVANPEKIKISDLDRWIKDTNFHMVGSYIAGLAARSPHFEKQMWKWMKSKKEFVRATGYGTLSSALREGKSLKKAEYKRVLKTIEKEIHDSPNRARYSMNNAVIAIGSWTNLEKEAITTARKIGKVDVDHGETSCKTPDAESYIEKARARLKKKK